MTPKHGRSALSAGCGWTTSAWLLHQPKVWLTWSPDVTRYHLLCWDLVPTLSPVRHNAHSSDFVSIFLTHNSHTTKWTYPFKGTHNVSLEDLHHPRKKHHAHQQSPHIPPAPSPRQWLIYFLLPLCWTFLTNASCTCSYHCHLLYPNFIYDTSAFLTRLTEAPFPRPGTKPGTERIINTVG